MTITSQEKLLLEQSMIWKEHLKKYNLNLVLTEATSNASPSGNKSDDYNSPPIIKKLDPKNTNKKQKKT